MLKPKNVKSTIEGDVIKWEGDLVNNGYLTFHIEFETTQSYFEELAKHFSTQPFNQFTLAAFLEREKP